MKQLVESRLLIFTALKLLQSQTASVMAKPKMTQRSKCMHDEKFVQEPFEETIHGGSKDYSLSCVDIMIKGTWPMEFKSSSACWGKKLTGEWFLRKYNDILQYIHLTRRPVNFLVLIPLKLKWQTEVTFLMTWTCGADFLSGSFCWVHLDVSSIKDQAATPWRARSLSGCLWNAQQDAAGITSIVPVSVQKQKSCQRFQPAQAMILPTPDLLPVTEKTGCKYSLR